MALLQRRSQLQNALGRIRGGAPQVGRRGAPTPYVAPTSPVPQAARPSGVTHPTTGEHGVVGRMQALMSLDPAVIRFLANYTPHSPRLAIRIASELAGRDPLGDADEQMDAARAFFAARPRLQAAAEARGQVRMRAGLPLALRSQLGNFDPGPAAPGSPLIAAAGSGARTPFVPPPMPTPAASAFNDPILAVLTGAQQTRAAQPGNLPPWLR